MSNTVVEDKGVQEILDEVKNLVEKILRQQKLSFKRILIADDNLLIAKMWGRALENTKRYLIETIHNTSKGTGMTKIESFQPDLVITDVIKPGQDGFSFCEEIRTKYTAQQLPVIFASNLLQKNASKEAEEVGAQAFISKSTISPTNLVNIIDELFGFPKSPEEQKTTTFFDIALQKKISDAEAVIKLINQYLEIFQKAKVVLEEYQITVLELIREFQKKLIEKQEKFKEEQKEFEKKFSTFLNSENPEEVAKIGLEFLEKIEKIIDTKSDCRTFAILEDGIVLAINKLENNQVRHLCESLYPELVLRLSQNENCSKMTQKFLQEICLAKLSKEEMIDPTKIEEIKAEISKQEESKEVKTNDLKERLATVLLLPIH